MSSPYGNYGYAVLTATARRAPDRVAISYGGRDLTYEELNRRVNRLASSLSDEGVGVGTHVACCATDPCRVVEVHLALAKLGAVLVATNPAWSPAVQRDVIDAAKATVVVTDAWPSLPIARGEDEEPAPGAAGDDPFACYFTSGTTGTPKGMVHTHASAIAQTGIWHDIPGGADTVWGTGPIVWGVGSMTIAGPTLVAGARLVLEDDFGPAQFLQSVPRHRITHVNVLPSFWSELLSTPGQEAADLSSLRVVLVGGEPLVSALIERIRARVPDAALYAYYGQAEAPYSTIGQVGDGARARTGGAVRVVDRQGQSVVGAVGEVHVSGPHVMRGYLDDAGTTASVLKDGWYRTGDLGVIDDRGVLTVFGRADDAILRHGRLVHPTEIEEAVLAVAGVAEAAAVGADHDRILLALVPLVGAEIDERAVRDALVAHLQPDRIVIVDELPHADDGSGGPGKLLRREIRERFGATD